MNDILDLFTAPMQRILDAVDAVTRAALKGNGISQVDNGLRAVDQVTQPSTTGGEESVTAAEQLST